jgi:cytochrome c-type biogenesis protein CcmH
MRCLVCQNESLAGSRSDLANDLRREIRTLIKEGKSDDQIRAFMVERYGDFVLYRPPVKSITWLLWLGPFVILLIGIAFLFSYLRRRNLLVQTQSLSTEENQKIDALLNTLGKNDRDGIHG